MSKTIAEHLQQKPGNNCRYRVLSVWGTMEDRLKVGSVIVDSDHGTHHDWNIYDLKTMTPIGGWCGEFIGTLEEAQEQQGTTTEQ